MHGIIISPMIYNVKRIYICLSDIFKLFQDFSREIQAIIRPHTNSHTILRFTTKRHIKRKNIFSYSKNIKSLQKGAPAMVTTINSNVTFRLSPPNIENTCFRYSSVLNSSYSGCGSHSNYSTFTLSILSSRYATRSSCPFEKHNK